MLKKRIGTTVGALALLAAGQAVIAPAASAAVPTCVRASSSTSGSRTTVTVRNGCSTRQSFIINWDNAFDSGCLTLNAGASLTRSKLFSSFQGLKNC